MMQCIDFQRACATEPDALDQSLIEHQKECRNCQMFVEEMKQLDRQLQSALKVSIGDGLVDDLLKLPDQRDVGTYSSNIVKFALAATVVLAVGLAFFQIRQFPYRPSTLPDIVYEHIVNEPEALAATEVLKQAVVRTKLSEFGIGLNAALSKVTHLTFCEVGDTHGVHLVMEGDNGPITLLFLPTRKIDKLIPLERDGFVGYITPAELGSMAIVGAQNEPLEKIQTEVSQAIEWL